MKNFRWLIVVAGVMLMLNVSYSQVGRHELPSDTTPIGGEEQRQKTLQMEGRDLLIKEVTVLRDSVATTLNEMKQQSVNVSDVDKQRYQQSTRQLTQQRTQLSEMIERLGSEQWNPEMTEQTYTKLKDMRREFYRIRKDFRK